MVYSLGQDYSTVSWRLTEPGMYTDFVCQKVGNQLHVTGEIDGKSTENLFLGFGTEPVIKIQDACCKSR
ncbi:TPA: hypothetical protein EYO57_14900 [Candidatus Poribacteria bacterium]|nr:hypothetical protein [Candidatus Poribacteria bacterium]